MSVVRHLDDHCLLHGMEYGVEELGGQEPTKADTGDAPVLLRRNRIRSRSVLIRIGTLVLLLIRTQSEVSLTSVRPRDHLRDQAQYICRRPGGLNLVS